MNEPAMFARLTRYWVYGGTLAGLLLLALLPALIQTWTAVLTAVFLQLPIYMLHQFEEHDDDRFRLYVNEHLGGGREVLSPLAVFIINVPGVWGVNAAAFLAAYWIHIGYGLIAIYLTLVNAAAHLVAAIVSRAYNPGVATSVILFLPAGIYGWLQFRHVENVGGGDHALGLVVAIFIHAAIVAHVQIMKRRLK